MMSRLATLQYNFQYYHKQSREI